MAGLGTGRPSRRMFFRIDSPSVVYKGLGSDAIAGYILGVVAKGGALNTTMKTVMNSAAQTANTTMNSSLNKMISSASSSLNRLPVTANSAMVRYNAVIQSGMNNSNVTITAGSRRMEQTVTSGMRSVQSSGTSGMNRFVQVIKSGMNSAGAAVSRGTSSMVGRLSGLSGSFYSSGLYASYGLARGINAGAGPAIAAARNVANQIAETMRSALDINSPSKVTEDIGEYTTKGAEVGMLNRLRNIKKVSKTIAEAMIPSVSISDRLAFAGNAGFDYGSSESYVPNPTYVFHLVMEADGREWARSTAVYTKNELDRMDRSRNRVEGRR